VDQGGKLSTDRYVELIMSPVDNPTKIYRHVALDAPQKGRWIGVVPQTTPKWLFDMKSDLSDARCTNGEETLPFEIILDVQMYNKIMKSQEFSREGITIHKTEFGKVMSGRYMPEENEFFEEIYQETSTFPAFSVFSENSVRG
jgi:hypothetical protein